MNNDKVLQIATQFKLNEKNSRAHKLLVRHIIDTRVTGIKRPRMNGKPVVSYITRVNYIMNTFAIKDMSLELIELVMAYEDARNQGKGQELVDFVYNNFFKSLKPEDKIAVIRRLPSAVMKNISNKVPNSTKNFIANVTTWMNANMMPVNKSNINNKKLAFIVSNINNTRKIRTVYNKNGLLAWLNKSNKSPKTQPSPMTRKMFNANNIINFKNK